MISMSDVARLDWFFSAGESEQQRSPMGSMLDRQNAFHVEHVPSPEVVAARRARKPWEADPGAITAQPTAELRNEGRYEPDSDYLVRYGLISKRLARVAAADSSARVVLSVYHGNEGARWGHSKAGRAGALVHMTATGQAVLRMAAKEATGAALDLSTTERLENLFAAGKHGAHLAKAVREANELYRHACEVWESVGSQEAM